MKKAFDQTVRDIKREVNKKVLKVPSIEQKVLDATSNEPWGPHGTVLADIAQASRNYHEYQMIMAVIWKRINDTGKNWRHVYKALTVLEYMVANGSERVIDDIREHAYQIQTLSDFQYIDSSGRDQGNNVRKKSQSLVVLVNDKERIAEVRQKAAANRDKYRGSYSGSMYRPGSGGFADERYDGRYGSRDDDRNGYGRERDYGHRDDDRYGDSYGRDGDRYGRDHEDRNGRDGYKDNDYRGRSRSVDAHQRGSRSRSSDRDRDHSYEEDGQNGSRRSVTIAATNSQNGSNLDKQLERKFSEQNIGAPPSYEEAVGAARSPTYSEPGGEIPSASGPTSYSSPVNASSNQGVHRSASQPAFTSPPSTASPPPHPPPPPTSEQKEQDSFDEFDPRGSFSAAAPVASSISAQNSSSAAEVDLLGSLSDSFSANSLALVPTESAVSATGTDTSGDSGHGFSAPVSSSLSTQTFDDPFGDGPFKAMPSAGNAPVQAQNNVVTSYPASSNQMITPPEMVTHSRESFNNTGDPFAANPLSSASSTQASTSHVQYSHQELSTPNDDFDILADILPPTAPQAVVSSQTSYLPQAKELYSQTGFPQQNNQNVPQTGIPQTGQMAPQSGFQHGSGHAVSTDNFSVQAGLTFLPQGLSSGQHVPQSNFYAQNTQPTTSSFTAPAGQALKSVFSSPSGQPASVPDFPFQMGSASHAGFQPQYMQQNVPFSGNYNPLTGSAGSVAPQVGSQVSAGSSLQPGSPSFLSQSGSVSSASSQITPLQSQSSAPVISQALVPVAPQPADDKFKTKSTVWTDTLNRGLVNLNISGPKTNPLADIGVDFDAINRREKRMEKPTTAPVISTVNMGKAMGSGTGLGRAGAGVLRPPSNPMVGSGMGPGPGYGSGMGAVPRPPMGMGGYGAVNQPMGGMGMSPNMGMGMNMGSGQGGQMQQPMGFPPRSAMPGGYNPMTGTGNYGQHPYGGGHRWSST